MSRKVYYTQVDFLEDYRGKAFSGEWPTISEAFSITVSRFPDNEALKSITPTVFTLTFREAYDKILSIASYLRKMGIKAGDNVAVCGKNSPQWALAYLAITFSGAVIVPLDHALKSEEMKNLIEFGDVKALFADDDKIEVDTPSLLFRVSLEGSDKYPYILDIEEEKCELPHRTCDDIAAILFTSGTTGNPKGVMLTHINLVSDSFKMLRYMTLYPTDVVYAVLPIHHAYTMTAVFLECMFSGACCLFGKRLVVPIILRELRDGKVTMFLAVPMIYNRFLSSIMAGIEKEGKVKATLVHFLMGLSGVIKRVTGINLGKKFFGKSILHKASLDGIRVCISGGGPLPASTFKRFNQLGLDFVQGYGLTETSPVTHLNPVSAYKEESVGKLIPTLEQKIVDPDEEGNGVLYIKGSVVMKGYYKNEESTKEVLSDDGWFNTGDVGHIDSEGYLYITGRAKSVIVTEGGKNVFPEELEDKFQLYGEVEQIAIIPYLINKETKAEGIRAVIYPNSQLLKKEGLDETAKRISEIVEEINRSLQSYKKITMVTVSDEPLPTTSTRKIKRFEVIKKYKEK